MNVITTWLASPLVRHFPRTPSQPAFPLCLDCALNEPFSFQVALRNDSGAPVRVHVDVEAPEGWRMHIRRVGFVPALHFNTPAMDAPRDTDGVGHIPGLVPDPLLDGQEMLLPPRETHAFWVSITPGENAEPGEHEVHVEVLADAVVSGQHTARVHLHPVRIQPRRDFRVTHWLYCDAIIDWYKTDLFDDRFWPLLTAYVTNAVKHGQDTVYVPVFTPPLDGVKRPTQLLKVSTDGRYWIFDWSDVRRYVELARACGIRYFEWCHLFTQWGASKAIRVYEGQGEDETLLWPPDTAADSETYRAFLSQFLPELKRFCEEEDILDRSFFHLSDEPNEDHLPQYRVNRALLHELAPWMKVMDALTNIEFSREGLTDMPVPSIKTALDFVDAGTPSWCYYCCNPRGKYLNRLVDTPLAKIAMHGFLFYRWPFQGFLHWGYNYWYRSQTRELIDPYCTLDAHRWPNWAYGDPFVVYPGEQGPVDSMRWEVFAEALRDYALLQTLGVERDDPLLAPIQSFESFPKLAEWRLQARRKLFERARKS